MSRRVLRNLTILWSIVFLMNIDAAMAAPDNRARDSTRDARTVEVDPKRKTEAADRFDRALKLFEAGDNASALAEFKQIYELLPDPAVLYNIGLVYAAMGRAVDAVDALEPVVSSAKLPPTLLARAKQTLAEQQARIGRLFVRTTPASARIEIDGIEVARTPLAAPLRVVEGNHVVGVVAEGHVAARKEVLVAGKADSTVEFELLASRIPQPANLVIRTKPVGASVHIDGKPMGKTPLISSLSLPAGQHLVELSRPGYRSVQRTITLDEASSGEIALDLLVDDAVLPSLGATLVIDAAESNIEVVVDGERKGLYREPLRLPPGEHRVTASAAGYVPAEYDVTLDRTQTKVLRVILEPTPETRRAYVSTARLHRTLGWIGIIGGAAVAGTGAVLSVVSAGKESDARSDLDGVLNTEAQSVAPCDWKSDYAQEESQPVGQRGDYLCVKAKSDARHRIDSAKQLKTIGFVAAGTGGAIAIAGLVLLVVGNDPHKYDHRATTRLQRDRWAVIPGPGEIGTGLRWEF